MRDSLRVRLLVWHLVTVTAVIVALGMTVGLAVWHSRVKDLDARLRARAAVVLSAVRPAPDDTFDVALPPAVSADSQGIYHALWTPRGMLLDRSDAASDVVRPETAGLRFVDGRREFAAVAPSGLAVLTGQDMSDIRREISALAGVLVASGGLVLAVSLAGGWVLAGRTLKPLSAINATARRMAGGELAARIPVDRLESELDDIGRALNDAFDRLQVAVERQRQFTADASHELRTPLTTLSAEIQWALGRPREASEYRASLEVALRASTRIDAVVTRLLALARNEAAAAPRHRVSLHEVITSVAADLRSLARDHEVDLALHLKPAVVIGDAASLGEAVSNVIANAIRYNAPGGRVTVDLSTDLKGVTVRIEDTGIGMAPEDEARAFDPFFRADPARTRDSGGAGLGLAVTKAVIEGCRGHVRCRSVLEQGTTIELWVPAAPPDPPFRLPS